MINRNYPGKVPMQPASRANNPTPRQAGSCQEGLAPLHIICSENGNELQAPAIGRDACARATSRGRGRSEKWYVEGFVVVIRTII